jgi:hypothetical protein
MLSLKQQFSFVLAIPIINVIADSTQNYFNQGLASPGYIRALIILIFIIIHFKDFYKNNSLNFLILISLIYFLILGFFSSDFSYTQSVFLKYFIASMMFPIGFYYFRNKDQFRSLIKILMRMLGIYVFFLLISNIFFLGSSDYLDESAYFGASRVNVTKAMMILVMLSPLSFRFETNKAMRRLNIFIIVVGIIFILLGVKRSAVLGLFLGYFIYFMLAPQKTKLTKGIFLVGMILFLTSSLYYDTLIQRIEARREAGRFDISQASEKESRIFELRATMDAYRNGSLPHKLFGSEFFNSKAYFKTTRMLHTDYATILNGAGMVGLILFLLIYFFILRQSFYFRRRFKSDPEKQDIMAVSIVLVIAVMITGISGTVTAVGLRSIAFLFWGASFSYANQELKKLRMSGFRYKYSSARMPYNLVSGIEKTT